MASWNTWDNRASDALRRVRDVAWSSLRPAIEHAIVLAEEAESLASIRTDQAMTNIAPSYPALVEKLALAAPVTPTENGDNRG